MYRENENVKWCIKRGTDSQSRPPRQRTALARTASLHCCETASLMLKRYRAVFASPKRQTNFAGLAAVEAWNAQKCLESLGMLTEPFQLFAPGTLCTCHAGF